MHVEWEVVLFCLLLIDSIGAVVVAWCGPQWFTYHFRPVSRFFPPAKGWATYYFILVLFIGYVLGAHQFIF